jgi:hypothetical protein
MVFSNAFQGRTIVSYGKRLPLGRSIAPKVTLDTLRTGALGDGLAIANPYLGPPSSTTGSEQGL